MAHDGAVIADEVAIDARPTTTARALLTGDAMTFATPVRTRSPLIVPSAAFAALAFSLTPSLASAQTITVANEGTLVRLDSHGTETKKRPLELKPEGVNRKDCLEDQRIRFTVMLAGFEAGDTLEAWAAPEGEDCAASSNREGGAARCWPLGGPIPLRASADVDLPVRKIVSSARPFAPSAPAPADTACGRVDQSTVSVQFLLFRSGVGEAPIATKAVDVVVDTVGPPVLKTAVIPDGRGGLDVTEEPAPFGGVAVMSAIEAYCERTNDSCSSSTFVARDVLQPDVAERTRCGRLTGAAGMTIHINEAEGKPLDVGVRYAVAVAGIDDFGNPGQLSEVQCAVPSGSPDAESSEGGCSMAGPGRSRYGGAAALSVLALALAFARARARRRPFA
jgi:hypothetical protein